MITISSERIMDPQVNTTPMREPAVAGMFYSGTERGLKKELRTWFRSGPGRDTISRGRRILGLVSPHAGYTYSGPTAAHGFIAAADGGLPSSVVVIGPNHTGLGKEVGVSKEDFRTPLGIVKNDHELFDAIGSDHDELSHLREHSMEVQLPFLQYLSKDIRQVCISMGHPMSHASGMTEEEATFAQAERVGKMVSAAIRKVDRDILIVASSDFTHCGPNYGYRIPPGMNAGEFARSRDEPVIDMILQHDMLGALQKKRELGTTACGMGPILAMMRAVSDLGESNADLLNYTTSYDVSPSHSAVGYASIAFFKK